MNPYDASVEGPDLEAINSIVELAVACWQLPERVHRLALPSLLYSQDDLARMHFALLDDSGADIGVAAWEEHHEVFAPSGPRLMLLHGLYVKPHSQRSGAGTRLLEYVEERCAARGFGGVVLRAWRDSEAFFGARGFDRLPNGANRDAYPKTLWKTLA